MRGVLSLVVLGLLLGTIGADPRSTPSNGSEHTARHSELAAHSPRASGAAYDAVAAVDRFAGGMDGTTVGVAVLDRHTGVVVSGAHGSEPIDSASVVKLIVAVDVLQRGRSGLSLGEYEYALLSRALGPSDDQAMNELWTRFDGQSGIERVAAQLGLHETHPPAETGQWGETELSARDVAKVYRHIMTRIPEPDRSFILDSMAHAPGIATGGFDQRFGLDGLSSASTPIKAGWMCCPDGVISLHSAGVVGGANRFVAVLLSTQPSSLGYDGARGALTDVARVLDGQLH